MSGILYLLPITKEKEVPIDVSLKIFGVRKKLFLPIGWEHQDCLSPSLGLFDQTKRFKRMNLWDIEKFHSFYAPKFLHEMTNRKTAMAYIQYLLSELHQGKNIAIACYCQDENMCHRSLLGRLFTEKGIQVISL